MSMKEHYDFSNAKMNPYISKLEDNFVIDEEMNEILENKKLLKDLEQGLKEVAEGKYRIVVDSDDD